MPWDKHGNYSRAYKVGGKVVREYLGRGEKAKAAFAEDLRIRAERKAQWEAYYACVAARKLADKPLLELNDLTRTLTSANLLSESYYQHDRGQWRPRNQCPNKRIRPRMT
jgi:hypothetical protein